jgi:hypothetical protein
MKNLSILLLCILVLIACDNQVTQPNSGDPPEIDKRGSPQELIVKNETLPRKNYKILPMLSEYNFNPNAPNNDF